MLKNGEGLILVSLSPNLNENKKELKRLSKQYNLKYGVYDVYLSEEDTVEPHIGVWISYPALDRILPVLFKIARTAFCNSILGETGVNIDLSEIFCDHNEDSFLQELSGIDLEWEEE